MLDCGPLNSNLTNGQVLQSGTLYEDFSFYRCDIGYIIEQGTTEKMITCQESGQWNDTAPMQCDPVGKWKIK